MMPLDLVAGSLTLRRRMMLITVAVMLVILAPGPVGADEALGPRPALASPHDGGAVTDTAAPATTSTSRPRQGPSADSSSTVLPLLLAAILFLALLVPSTTYHSHGHRHPH